MLPALLNYLISLDFSAASLLIYKMKNFLIFLALFGPLISQLGASDKEPSAMTPSCASKHAGSWFSLKRVTSLKMTRDCRFQLSGPNCDSEGLLEGALEDQGEVLFRTTRFKENSSCPFPGEKSCKYIFLNNELLLSCADQKHESFILEKDNFDPNRFEEDAAQGDTKAKKELAIYYLKNNKKRQAERILKDLAKSDDEEAPSALGILYFYGGKGFSKNSVESLKWNQIAAEIGNPESKYLVGQHYYHGLAIKKSYAEARNWFQKAALENHVPAQKALAQMWSLGVEGVIKKDDAKYYLKLAIEQGDNQAASMLSHLDDEPVREVAQSAEPSKVSSEKTEKSDYYFSKSLFLMKPYFLSQQRQGGVPSLAFGVTPGIETELFSIKLQATVSWLNVALGDPFTAFELATLFGIKTNSLLYELGYGLDFWPSPGGRAHTVSASIGKILSADLQSMFSLKSISVGFSQTFFVDHVYKCFVALSF
jgi:Tfp pilus assembly protein PilF